MAGAAAKRYARAIFELAEEEGRVDEWTGRLATVRDALTHPDAREVLGNPSIAARRRQDAAAALVEARTGREGANLAKLLVGAGRIGDVDAIVEEYQLLADERAGRVRAVVTTAVQLNRAETDELVSSLSGRIGREVRIETRVDPAIVGGLVVRIGDRVIDASVAARLQQLRRQLAGL